MGYDIVQSYKWLTWPGTRFQSAQEVVDEVVLKKSTDDLLPLCWLSQSKRLDTVNSRTNMLNISLLVYSKVFWEHIQLNQYWSY